MGRNPLSGIVVAERPGKPRGCGLTMVADWGMPVREQEDFLAVASPFVDLAKIAVGISALFEAEILSRKLALYAAADILTFPGGQFLEYAVIHGRVDEYMRACAQAGFPCIEVSDNLLTIDLESKSDLIRQARERYGLRVIGEVGKKEGLDTKTDLVEDAARCLSAGAERVFLEAADFFAGEIDEGELERIAARCGRDSLLFELPGPWIEGVNLSDVHRIMRWLVDGFGPEVNIANVSPGDVLKLEALRLGIGVNAGG